MSTTSKQSLQNLLRWGIALFGICYVVPKISLYDRVRISSPVSGWPISVRLAAPANEDDQTFVVQDPVDETKKITIQRTDLLAKADPVRVTVREDGELKKYDTLARKVVPDDANRDDWPI